MFHPLYPQVEYLKYPLCRCLGSTTAGVRDKKFCLSWNELRPQVSELARP